MNFKKIPIDSKAGENYFGHFSQQLKAKGGVAFQAISDRLVLKLINKAFAKGAECMLKSKNPSKWKLQKLKQIGPGPKKI